MKVGASAGPSLTRQSSGRLSSRLDELKGKANIKGFRPGHVPKEHLRKVYGRSVMAEVVQQAVNETSQQALAEREERPAFQPKVGLPEDEEATP